MDDLISRQAVIKTLCERRCGNKPKGCPSGFCTESLAVDCIPSAHEENSEDTRAAYEQGRIQGHVEMRTALLRQLKEIVGDEVWKNI